MIFDKLNKNAIKIVSKCENEITAQFEKVDNISLYNQDKVLSAFKEYCVGLRHFSGTTGYGYDDIGRDTLNRVFARIFDSEKAIVSPHMMSGTHALTIALFGILRPNDLFLSITGQPYETMRDVINGKDVGSLKDFDINFTAIDLLDNNFDYARIEDNIKKSKPKMIYIQRSRGYSWRNAVTISSIEKVTSFIKQLDCNICIFVDNCYGEFVETKEPTSVGADVVVGSLIKNPGGGIAPSGGYVAGKSFYITQIENRLSAPSVGGEIGSYAAGYQYFYQGLFISPHVTAQALKGAMLMTKVMSEIGYQTLPRFDDDFGDIICSIKFDTKEQLISFCQNIQSCSPIDGHVTPIPWDMPGYENQVIMAAGCFVQGASIELSCDSPIKKPYIAYVQGGLTYEHVKLAVLKCVDTLLYG